MTDLKQFRDQEFLSLETFRKNGVGVKTPIWFAQEGDVRARWLELVKIQAEIRIHTASEGHAHLHFMRAIGADDSRID